MVTRQESINRSEVAKNDLENIAGTHLADKGMINDKQSLIIEGSAIIVHSASC